MKKSVLLFVRFRKVNLKSMRQNVLIIGASGDIGIAIAKERAKIGDQLILHFHSNKLVIDELVKEIATDQVLQIIQADLSKQSGIEKLTSSMVFSVDVIIFASGKTEFGLFQDVKTESMDEMLTLHVKAPWMITSFLLPAMVKKQFGKIIFITSIWGEAGASFEVLYSSVKGAQNSFVKALAKEVAPCNISVFAVSPGYIETKMNLSLTEEEREDIYEAIPLKRPGTTYEVAAAVNFLVDQRARAFNGKILPVSGGWML